jgi:hypothetical protein
MIASCLLRRRLLMAGWVILTLLGPAGCGWKEPQATVEGKVTVDGAPANSGIVAFTSVDGKGRIASMAGAIQSDGTYRIPNAPLGAVKVSVAPLTLTQTRGARRKEKVIKRMEMKQKGQTDLPQAAPAPDAPVVPIPKKYADADSSGLTTTLNPGTNTYDIELSSR